MKTKTGYTHLNIPLGAVRVPIPQHHFGSDAKVNYAFRNKITAWLMQNCGRAEYEYPDEVCIYPVAVYIDPELSVIFRLMFS